ncbi:MAG TPA: aldo/keto reductase [Paraburkholderia sp.]|nr:aldo/keto reductase [Paraburkholderia sp.]
MRLTGPGIFGFPVDRDNARKVLRRAVDLGVNFIDTADVYGPQANEIVIGDALAPYKKELVIATKAGYVHGGANTPPPLPALGRPEYIYQQVELSLRNLKVEQLALWQLHDVDPTVPIEETLGAAAKLQQQGKIRDIGLSNVTIEHIERARKVVDVVSVQNLYNIAYRDQQPVVEYCEKHDMAFLPYFPLGGRWLPMPDKVLAQIAQRYDATPAQICLAWLLHRSPAILPIPGTASLQHLEENMKSTELSLSDEQWAQIEAEIAAANRGAA